MDGKSKPRCRSGKDLGRLKDGMSRHITVLLHVLVDDRLIESA